MTVSSGKKKLSVHDRAQHRKPFNWDAVWLWCARLCFAVTVFCVVMGLLSLFGVWGVGHGR